MWFDGFSAEAAGRYAVFGDPGGWRISNGKLTQDIAGVALQGLTPTATFDQPQVSTTGQVLTLLPSMNDAGVTVDHHAVVTWVSADLGGEEPDGCRVELDDTGGGGSTYATLYRRALGDEMLLDTSPLGPELVNNAFRIAALTTSTSFTVTASIGSSTVLRSPLAMCPRIGGRVALGTRFARASFDYLMIATACVGPSPCACPPPPEM